MIKEIKQNRITGLTSQDEANLRRKSQLNEIYQITAEIARN